MDRRIAGYLLGLVVLAADQITKYWVLHGLHLQDGHRLVVLPVVNFVLVWNHGITFGMFAGDGARLLLATIASVVIIALCIWLWRSKTWVTALAVGAITGGAIGNVADRLRYGAVVDFIQVHVAGIYFPWVFNVGDSAICCGVAVLMLDNLFRRTPVAASDGQR
jgi:lipoprotein signal peptidase